MEETESGLAYNIVENISSVVQVCLAEQLDRFETGGRFRYNDAVLQDADGSKIVQRVFHYSGNMLGMLRYSAKGIKLWLPPIV